MNTYTQTAANYKNGRIDRRAESLVLMRKLGYEIIRQYHYGTLHYMAAKTEDAEDIFALILKDRTSEGTISFDVYHENEGPEYCQCTEYVLECLSPTQNKNARKWREQCLHVSYKDEDAEYVTSLQAFDQIPVGGMIVTKVPNQPNKYFLFKKCKSDYWTLGDHTDYFLHDKDLKFMYPEYYAAFYEQNRLHIGDKLHAYYENRKRAPKCRSF
jgi:hypothetical protein